LEALQLPQAAEKPVAAPEDFEAAQVEATEGGVGLLQESTANLEKIQKVGAVVAAVVNKPRLLIL
jgi:hypothetical protein